MKEAVDLKLRHGARVSAMGAGRRTDDEINADHHSANIAAPSHAAIPTRWTV